MYVYSCNASSARFFAVDRALKSYFMIVIMIMNVIRWLHLIHLNYYCNYLLFFLVVNIQRVVVRCCWLLLLEVVGLVLFLVVGCGCYCFQFLRFHFCHVWGFLFACYVFTLKMWYLFANTSRCSDDITMLQKIVHKYFTLIISF